MRTKHSREGESRTQTDSAFPSALIVGSGMSALVAAQTLRELGANVSFARVSPAFSRASSASPGPNPDDEFIGLPSSLDGVHVAEGDQAPLVRREREGFKAFFEDGTEKSYDCVVLSPDITLKPRQSMLPPDVELFTSEIEVQPLARIAFVMDCEYPSDPSLGMTAIKMASRNVKQGGASVVCFRNVPVRHLHGETLYDEARRTGVQFVRYGDEVPVVSHPADLGSLARFRLTARDAIDTDNQFVFECDKVLTVTAPDPSSLPEWAKEMMGRGDVDDQGFAGSDSVHCHSGRSFARGIFVVGKATGNLDPIDGVARAKAAATKAYAWMRTARLKDRVMSITSACVGCLTCYGICPHEAISIEPGTSRSTLEIWPSLCQACGICASICPAAAITSGNCPDDSLFAVFRQSSPEDRMRTTFVLGCERSAGILAQSIQLPEHVKFLTVPCAGRVSEHVIWSTLAAGAKGVLVVGCHHGNCASRTGTDWAAARIRRGSATGLFGQDRRLGYATVAANESARFQRLLREFSEETSQEAETAVVSSRELP